MSRVGGRLGDAYAYDASWVEATDKRAAQIRERLESDLNGSKTNMIKESIRMVGGPRGEGGQRRRQLLCT